LIYKIFHKTGVGSFTICAAFADVTLANVVPAGIAVPVVAAAVIATAVGCTQPKALMLVAFTVVTLIVLVPLLLIEAPSFRLIIGVSRSSLVLASIVFIQVISSLLSAIGLYYKIKI